ncbi:MAG TPA: GNAT family N-acetyltransferase [Vicinamibacterales bacterium]|nr:GNAT family N-acetyltransferase [Vicinamibacterales bacterium]
MRLTDKTQIRALLQSDPRWCVYAIGDLTPRMFVKCSWFTPDIALVLHDYGTSILFAHGTGSIEEALSHVAWPVHLQLQQDAIDEVARHATVTNVKHMWRMSWDGGETEIADGVKRLGPTDLGALKRLYADGESSGESPDFFHDSMVADGVFFGVYEGPDLIAAAGTHLFAPDEQAAAIGNVYTRRDRRSQGLSRQVTSAVLHRLRYVTTVGLNVRHDNAAAIRVYESLGFVKHCDFYEGIARPRV